MALPQINNVFRRYYRSNQLVVKKNSLHCRKVQHLAVIEQPPPERAAVPVETLPVTIFKQKNAVALRTRVKERLDAENLPALQATVYKIT
jgi:hypothetical protein